MSTLPLRNYYGHFLNLSNLFIDQKVIATAFKHTKIVVLFIWKVIFAPL